MAVPLTVLREFVGLSQAEFARQLETSRQCVWRVEQGLNNFSYQKILKLFSLFPDELEELGLTHEDFMRGEVSRSRLADRKLA